MWISMCKNSEYLVKRFGFIHNPSTLDENKKIDCVHNYVFMNTMFNVFHKLIPTKKCFGNGIISGFTRFPHKLLLLLLHYKLNIINKTVIKRRFV